MTHIFCTKKLESFIGPVDQMITETEESKLGNWNGHLFAIERRKILIFTNDKTAYSFFIIGVVKNDVKDFASLFRESLIKQLYNVLKVSERQEIMVRRELNNITLCPTNNNRKILGTINEFVQTIKHHAHLRGGLDWIENIEIGGYLNDSLVGAKLALSTEKYFHPKDLMNKLLQ